MDKPDHAFIDIDNKILFKLDLTLPPDMAKSLLKDGNVYGRIIAANILIKKGNLSDFNTVSEQLSTELFWGVRSEIIKLLGDSNSRFAIPILVRLIKEESHPRVRMTLMDYAGKYRDTRIEEALHQLLSGDILPYARSGAIRALGKQMTSTSLEKVESYLDAHDWKYMSRGAAFSAITSSRDQKYLSQIISGTKSGSEPEYIRQSVISNLGQLAKWLPNHLKIGAREQLEDILRDEFPEIRMTAARSLRTMGAKESISKIAGIKSSFTHQEQLDIDSVLVSLNKSDGSNELKTIAKRLEDAESKIMKLEEKVQKMKKE